MNKTKIFLQLIFCMIIQLGVHAAEISTLTITLINESTREFIFERAVVKYEGNTLKIDKLRVKPRETAIITGTTTAGFDLKGILYFNGQAAQFYVEDRRQFHHGQPIFTMHADNILSKISSRTFNPVKDPRLLSYTAATVVLSDR